jgi:predicted solute-binding protein
MSKKLVDEEHSLEALKDLIKHRKKGQPVEEVLTIFCQRYGLTMAACREYYDELVKKGQIKEK